MKRIAVLAAVAVGSVLSARCNGEPPPAGPTAPPVGLAGQWSASTEKGRISFTVSAGRRVSGITIESTAPSCSFGAVSVADGNVGYLVFPTFEFFFWQPLSTNNPNPLNAITGRGALDGPDQTVIQGDVDFDYVCANGSFKFSAVKK